MLLLAVHAVLCISGVLAAGEREFPRSQGNPEHRKAYKRCWSQISEAVVGKPPCGVHHAPGNVSSTRTNPGRTPSNAKVALLFLARSEIPTESIWTAFFASAAELTLRRGVPPTAPLHHPILPTKYTDVHCARKPLYDLNQLQHWHEDGDYAWDKQAEAWLGGPCAAVMTGREVYQQQDLFSIYLHRTPGAPAFPQDSIFYGRDINDRIFTSWGDITLVQALRNLLVSALADPLNSKFVLVSESCIPLRHPALFWAQHMAEAHLSRVGSRPADMNNARLEPLINQDLVAHGVLHEGQQLQVYKASQFLSLTRMHAQLIAKDDHLWPLFSKWCRTKGECEHYNFDTSTDGFCMPDERYAATVLNFYNQTGTVANTGITFSDWTSWGRSRDGAHPRTFWKGQAEFAVSLLLDSYNGGSLDGCFREQLKSGPTAGALFQHEDLVCPTSHKEPSLRNADVFNAAVRRLEHIASVPSNVTGIQVKDYSEAPEAITGLQTILARNLRQSGWLGQFRPMDHGCPLIGRKVHRDLVPELLPMAWRCDGLGFAWECLSSVDIAKIP